MFLSFEEASRLIDEGRILHIAGDESLLSRLPKGNWIGGTTPYFITNDGGIMTKEKLFVNEMPLIDDFMITVYDVDSVLKVGEDAFPNGATFLLMPFGSEIAAHYSKESPNHDSLLMTPIVGWISGFDLDSGGEAKVFDGTIGRAFTNKAVALHIALPPDNAVLLNIINIFESDSAKPELRFPADGSSIRECTVDGKQALFADYIKESAADTQMPLIADYNGVMVNVSIKSIDEESKTVYLYAPVFAEQKYRFASPVADYEQSFKQRLTAFEQSKPLFSCNCILNYLYGGLEGKATPPFEGPVTFGEIAYQLLNQTLVYLELIK